MKGKKFFLISLIILLCSFVYAGSYSISITNAENVGVSGDVYELSGNVILKFSTTEENQDSTERTLSAKLVRIDTEKKILEASGDVVLTQNDDSFNGQTVVLDWEELDVVVYNGTSASDRSNAGGDSVKFFASGERISYAGGEDTVFFSDGVVSTKEKDPYWSVKASNIGLLESDLFFENATVRIGRVPVLWIPFFFYPGTKMAFNPAMGLSSSKGMFLNTTTEIYGAYPALGTGKSSNKSGSSEDDAAASILSFMSSDKGDLVRDGIVYRSIDDVELSDFEKKAREKGNYLAVFADVYEKLGPAIGYDTKNKLGDFDFSSVSVLGLNKKQMLYPEFRYATVNKINWNSKKTKLSLDMPYYSDPDSASSYLNRNSVFDITSVFGSEQTFPSQYSTVYDFDWALDASTSFEIGKTKLNINSVTSDVGFDWNSSLGKYEVTHASLPYVSVSASGTIFSLQGKKETKTVEKGYESELAASFAEELENKEKSEKAIKSSVQALSGPSVSTQITKEYPASYLKSSYTFKQTFSNQYLKNMQPERLTTDVSGSISLSGALPRNIMSATVSSAPSYKYEGDRVKDSSKQNFTLPVSFKLGLPFVNVSYVLTGNVLKASAQDEEWTQDVFDFTDKYVTEHYLEASEKIGNFKFAIKTNLKPLVQSVVPSVSYSDNGFSISSNATYYFENEDSSKVNKVSLNLGYSKNSLSFSFNNDYDLSKTGWEGLTSTQNLSYKFNKKLSVSEKLTMKDAFKTESLVLSAVYDKTTVRMSFTGEDFEKDTLDISSDIKINPVYTWKKRIGFSANLNSKFSYDFANVYGTSVSLNMSLEFAIKDFLSVAFSVKTANTSFFRYYEDGRFMIDKMWEDLKNSFAFFEPEKRRNTGFNLSSYSLDIVHNMEDWDLFVSASTKIVNNNGNPAWDPQVSVYMKWRAIPELKVENNWKEKSGWEK